MKCDLYTREIGNTILLQGNLDNHAFEKVCNWMSKNYKTLDVKSNCYDVFQKCNTFCTAITDKTRDHALVAVHIDEGRPSNQNGLFLLSLKTGTISPIMDAELIYHNFILSDTLEYRITNMAERASSTLQTQEFSLLPKFQLNIMELYLKQNTLELYHQITAMRELLEPEIDPYWESFKDALITNGKYDIEEFLGYELPYQYSLNLDRLHRDLDEAHSKMSNEVLHTYYQLYHLVEKSSEEMEISE